MCRDGYRAECAKQHCAEVVRCRDWPGMCPEHAERFEISDDEPATETDRPLV